MTSSGKDWTADEIRRIAAAMDEDLAWLKGATKILIGLAVPAFLAALKNLLS